MTDTEAATRLAHLQQRRAASSPGPTGGAVGSKIASAGIGVSAMLGLVAAMGLAGHSSADQPPGSAQPPAAAQLPAGRAEVVVLVHPVDGTTTQATAPASATPVTAASSQPIVLSAQPAVRQAPAASPSPTGTTHGSR